MRNGGAAATPPPVCPLVFIGWVRPWTFQRPLLPLLALVALPVLTASPPGSPAVPAGAGLPAGAGPASLRCVGRPSGTAAFRCRKSRRCRLIHSWCSPCTSGVILIDRVPAGIAAGLIGGLRRCRGNHRTRTNRCRAAAGNINSPRRHRSRFGRLLLCSNKDGLGHRRSERGQLVFDHGPDELSFTATAASGPGVASNRYDHAAKAPETTRAAFAQVA